MINTVRILFVSMLLAVCMVSPLLAGTVRLHGTIKDSNNIHMYFSFNNSEMSLKKFPLKHYEFAHLFAYDLTYDSPTKKNDYFDHSLSEFAGDIQGDLDLVSIDQRKNIYHFQLTLKSCGLDYRGYTDGKLSMVGGIPFDGNITLSNLAPAVFNIDVQLIENAEGKPKLINLGKNPYFQLEFSARSLNLHLIRYHDIPVIITRTS